MSQNNFKLNELCWVKIKGYPWWPAVITNIQTVKDKKKYFAFYICESKYSEINEENIKKWKENYESFHSGLTYKKPKNANKDFQVALKVAELLNEEKITLTDHKNFLEEYKSVKERHNLINVEKYFNKIIAKNQKKKKEEITKNNEISKIKKNKKKPKENIKIEKTNLLGKKRKLTPEKKFKNIEKDIVNKKIEITISRKDMSKINSLTKVIVDNLDIIINKNEKYHKFFSQQYNEKILEINDDKNTKSKIELIKYLKLMCEIFNAPISLNKLMENLNDPK